MIPQLRFAVEVDGQLGGSLDLELRAAAAAHEAGVGVLEVPQFLHDKSELTGLGNVEALKRLGAK